MSIVFDRVWKQFQRGEIHDSLRDLLPALALGVLGRQPKSRSDQVFWALRDVSFEVTPGQALGIIGPNGAGKSTTLKILTRILEPTQGTYRVDGRIGSLLEIGAGFHPDLTGRDNVFLQGTILGMRRQEIQNRFDQIVEFAGVEEFIDTPVKRYSTGMNARLGFSIAAHLDCDALIIDEILATGDFTFQARAFDRIRTMITEGKPVVLVSHQLDRVASLCTHALLLDHGAVRKTGTPEECIAEYIGGGGDGLRVLARDVSLPIEFTSMEVLQNGPVRSGECATIAIEGVLHGPLDPSLDPLGFRIIAAHSGREVSATSAHECGLAPLQPGPFAVELTLEMNVKPGIYLLESAVLDWTRWSRVASGPSRYLHVVAGPPFRGNIQMQARMRLLGPA
ncbi:MAG: ABC transporter ATP-binding protein [Gemmatimonadales bacterium]